MAAGIMAVCHRPPQAGALPRTEALSLAFDLHDQHGMVSGSVLVVEDDADLRESVVALLKAEGLTATGAPDGEEALHLLRQGPVPSVILLDLTMPRMDGWRFRVQQTREPRLAGIPVIIVSGHWNAREAGSILGAKAVVPKPPDVDKLLAAIGQLCLH